MHSFVILTTVSELSSEHVSYQNVLQLPMSITLDGSKQKEKKETLFSSYSALCRLHFFPP